MSRYAWLLAVLLTGCEASIVGGALPVGGDQPTGGAGPGGGTGGPSNQGGGTGSSTPVDECEGVTATTGTWPLQRLTSAQLDRTVARILGDTTHAMKTRLLSADEVINNRLRYELATTGNTVVGEGLVLAGEDVSIAAVANPAFAAEVACPATDAPGKKMCATRFISKFGRKLWRRTLTPAEVTTLAAVYDSATTAGSPYPEALQTVLHAILASPDFFFFQQPGAPGSLTGTVLAERLAFALWQEPPDDALVNAAEAGTLDTPAGLRSEIDRLLADPRADLALADFLKHWLAPEKSVGIDRALAAAARSPGLYPDFKAPSDGADGDAMARALDAYLSSTARAKTGTFSALLLSDRLAVNEAVARNLKLPQPSPGATELRRTDRPQRVGVMGQPAFLTAYGRFESSDPVHRGVFLLRQALCQDVPPPDASVNTTLPPVTDFKTTRDRFTTATIDGNCAGCHRRINPLGFSFENFDAVGGFRDSERGNPVDATAQVTLVPGQAALPVDGLADLAALIAQRPEVRACLVRQYGSYTLHRTLSSGEYCALKQAASGFLSNDGDFRQLLVGVLTSAPFAAPAVP